MEDSCSTRFYAPQTTAIPVADLIFTSDDLHKRRDKTKDKGHEARPHSHMRMPSLGTRRLDPGSRVCAQQPINTDDEAAVTFSPSP
jgi:hypothetical protein